MKTISLTDHEISLLLAATKTQIGVLERLSVPTPEVVNQMIDLIGELQVISKGLQMMLDLDDDTWHSKRKPDANDDRFRQMMAEADEQQEYNVIAHSTPVTLPPEEA